MTDIEALEVPKIDNLLGIKFLVVAIKFDAFLPPWISVKSIFSNLINQNPDFITFFDPYNSKSKFSVII